MYASFQYVNIIGISPKLMRELLLKASTVTFNNPHSAGAISTGSRIIKTKRKRGKIPSSAHCYAR